jgi:hypothetical protein
LTDIYPLFNLRAAYYGWGDPALRAPGVGKDDGGVWQLTQVEGGTMLVMDKQVSYDSQNDGNEVHKRHEPRPEILGPSRRKMAVVHAVGDPDRVMHLILPGLYSSVSSLKRDLKRVGRDFKVDNLHVRWPDAHLMPRQQWHGVWGLPIPEGIASLPQRVLPVEVEEVEIETWEPGPVARVIHHGPLGEQGPDIDASRHSLRRMPAKSPGLLKRNTWSGPSQPYRGPSSAIQ